MSFPSNKWPGLLIAVAAGIVMIVSGAGIALGAVVVVVWIGTLLLDRAPPPVAAPMDSRGSLTRARIESMLEPLGVPLLLVDRGRIAVANAAARAALGGHIVGQDARIALRHPEAIALLDREGSVTIPGLTGSRSIWEVSRRPIDERQAMIELINRTAEADISRAHTDFVANASHELSTPLASIIGYVETLTDDEAGKVDAETRSKFLGTVLREAKRLQSLVQDLMSLSRVEAEKHDRPRDAVDLGQLVASVASEISATRGDGRVVVEWPRKPATIEGDRSQLDQLARNLIDNALKYGDQHEPVRVTVSEHESHIGLTIEDRGSGIAPEHLPHLTRRFYRTDPGRSRAAGGTGLGLAIVKHIVERHRGKLDIASRVGEGTTVTIRFDRRGDG